ncbi:hypothetical protein [Tersicoccus phoenicis]|nr:hypothetical protein [Tersicoccus phoenicis]
MIAYRNALKARRDEFIADSSAEYADADTDEVHTFLDEARREAR